MAKLPLLTVPSRLRSPRLYTPQIAALASTAEIVVPDWCQVLHPPPHPEEARSAVSKDGHEHLVYSPSFETLAALALQDEVVSPIKAARSAIIS